MEYCPFCQKWVEPKKGHTDLVAGIAGSLVLGNLRPLAAGAGHYALKGSRCPICNNVISGIGAKTPVTPAQVSPHLQAPAAQSFAPGGSAPAGAPPIQLGEATGRTQRVLIPSTVELSQAIAIVLSCHYPSPLSEHQLVREMNYSWKTVDRRTIARATAKLKREGLVFFDKTSKGWQLSGAGYQWAAAEVASRFVRQEAAPIPAQKDALAGHCDNCGMKSRDLRSYDGRFLCGSCSSHFVRKRIGQVIAVAGGLVQIMDMQSHETFEVSLTNDIRVRSRLKPGVEIKYQESQGQRTIVEVTGKPTPTW